LINLRFSLFEASDRRKADIREPVAFTTDIVPAPTSWAHTNPFVLRFFSSGGAHAGEVPLLSELPYDVLRAFTYEPPLSEWRRFFLFFFCLRLIVFPPNYADPSFHLNCWSFTVSRTLDVSITPGSSLGDLLDSLFSLPVVSFSSLFVFS